MIKRTGFLLFLYIMLSGAIYGQEIMHSIGSSVSVSNATLVRPSTRVQDRFNFTTAYLSYFVKVNLPVNDYSSVSLGTPLGVGATFINSSFMQLKGTYFTYDLPIALDYNVGFRASADPGDDVFGFYLGLGFSVTHVQLDSISDTPFKPSTTGVFVRVGGRFAFPDSEKHRGATLGLFYKFNSGVEKFKTAGINVLLDL